MNLATMRKWKIPEGNVMKVEHGANELWRQIRCGYVSLGDSIAAGHTINDDWETEYGYSSQYGEGGNASTVIVPESYTDLIRSHLNNEYGSDYVFVKSFARSGDTVEDLINKLDHAVVRNSIEKADLVTVCIGANDVLQPAMLYLNDYINGSMEQMLSAIETNLARLSDDSYAYSYKALLDKLYSINPSAKYVFTTVYNPYKYLYLEESTSNNNYKDGFLGPLMWAIPDIAGDIVANSIRGAFLNTSVVKNLFSKINELNVWAEQFVTSLNNVINSKIYASGNPNFIVADTKAVFDSVPDRNITALKHYNDLVNVEFTRGFVVEDMDWGKFWDNVDWGTALSNIDQIAAEIMNVIVNEVIVPDVDPHPEWYGHYVMRYAISDALKWDELSRHKITFVANGGAGSMPIQNVVTMEGYTAYTNIARNAFTHNTEGYHFTGWNTKADGSGVSYSNGQLIGLSGDITLYAQWSNLYKIAYQHTNHTELYNDDETGHMECYALYINGELMPKLGKFNEGNRPVYNVPYGSTVKVVVSNYNPTELTYDDVDCTVYWNGATVARGYRGTEYTFTLTNDVLIDFWWEIAGSLITFDAQSWEDCYITTL